jgi:transposase
LSKKLIRGKKQTMRKIKEILRHHYELKMSNENTAFCVGVSKGSVHNILEKFSAQNLKYEELMQLSERDLLGIFYPITHRRRSIECIIPDFKTLALEMSKPHTTIQILYEEYKKQSPKSIGRTTFFKEMNKALSKIKVDLHIHHIGGEKLYLDYSGDKVHFFDLELNKIMAAEIFVASWGASSKCYIEVSRSQKKHDWIASNMRALRFFGGAPTYLVPDNLKSAVIKADYWDPTINETYRMMTEHFGTTVLPARSRKPKDKAVVEANVRAVEKRILSKIRNETFNSFEDLQLRFAQLRDDFNAEPMQVHKCSRNDRFVQLDQPYLKPLPKDDFTLIEVVLDVKVQDDHHLYYDEHYYSVPWEWTGSKVDVWNRSNVIEIYHFGERIACHIRGAKDKSYTTNEEHRPPQHRFVKNLKPCYVLSEASLIGTKTLEAFRNIIDYYIKQRHCEVGVRKCMGMLRLRKLFSNERIEKAMDRALTLACVKENDIRRILQQNLEDSPLWDKNEVPIEHNENITIHENIRGDDHYRTIKGE